MLLPYLLFILGFIFLIKGADYLVDGASSLAKKLGLSPLFVGLTIVAFGTSAPELFVNIAASIEGSAGIAIGNVVGSNIANILLILGLSAMIYPLRAKDSTLRTEIPLAFLAVLALLVSVNDRLIDGLSFNALSRSEGLMFWLFFIIFIYYTFGIIKNPNKEKDEQIKERKGAMIALMISGGLIALVFGSKLIVDNGLIIASALGISEALVGLTLIAVGTSLPELATSAMAAYRKKPDIAIGNIVGSNIFNIFFVLGTSSLVRPIAFDPALNFDIIATLLATFGLLLAFFVGKKKVLERWQGCGFLFLYLLYIVYLINRG
ncbi:MAG: calcium/sodium antiporter [Candidatus Pacebacteria bacterium]|nr:calcium/sodium antiporter [Candidatus Paceibacterota bacterium]